jgi:hypothetical protein
MPPDLVRGASQSPKSLPSTLSSSLMSSWNAGSSALALLPAKRLPFLATALQENRHGRERQRGQRVPLSRAGLPRRRQETSAWSCLVVECSDDDCDNQLGQFVIYRISPDPCYETTDQKAGPAGQPGSDGTRRYW